VVVQYIEPTTENGFTSYETTLERQLYRAMNQLERLQLDHRQPRNPPG